MTGGSGDGYGRASGTNPSNTVSSPRTATASTAPGRSSSEIDHAPVTSREEPGSTYLLGTAAYVLAVWVLAARPVQRYTSR